MNKNELVWLIVGAAALLAFWYYYSALGSSMSDAVNGGDTSISGNYAD